MWTPMIGGKAGMLWKILSEKGPQSINALKELSKLDEKWLYLSLGWLAREDKITVAHMKNTITIGLK